MIIYNFDVVRVAAAPPKTDAPLAIDADAVLTFPIAFERFQSIARRNEQILQTNGRVQETQLRQGDFLNVLRQSAGKFAIPNLLCFAVAKACDQSTPDEYIRQANML